MAAPSAAMTFWISFMDRCKRRIKKYLCAALDALKTASLLQGSSAAPFHRYAYWAQMKQVAKWAYD